MFEKLGLIVDSRRQDGRLLKLTLTLLLFALASLGANNAHAHLPACNGAAYCNQAQAYDECNAYTRTEFLPDPVLRDECRFDEPYSSGDYEGRYQYFFWLPDGGGGESGPYADEYFYYKKNLADKEANRGKPDDCMGCFGDPIFAGTANKFEIHSEYRGEGDFPLEMQWTYNSTGTSSAATATDLIFGRNRSHTYARRVNLSSIGSAAIAFVSRPDGKTLRFDQSGSLWVGAKNRSTELYSDVVGSSITGWVLKDGKGGAEFFDATGRLSELIDAQGRKQVLSYDGSGRLAAVTDMAGRAMVFEYGSSTLLDKLNLPDGSFIQFYYSPDNDLERVQYPDGAILQYRYDEIGYAADANSNGALTGVIDETGSRFASTTYDASGQALGTYAPGNLDAHSATYQLAADGTYFNQSTISLPGGATRELAFSSVQGMVRPTYSYTSCTGCTATEMLFSYDANGWPNTITTNGVQLDLDYDVNGHLTQKVDAATDYSGRRRTTQTDWHASLDVPIERRLYDASDVLVAKSTWTYNVRGQALTASQTDPVTAAVRTSTTTYCEPADITNGTCPLLGLVKSVNGPRTDVTDTATYTYYASDDASCTSSPTTCPHRKGDLWKVTTPWAASPKPWPTTAPAARCRSRTATALSPT